MSSEFKKIVNELLEERSIIHKKREMYPRGIKDAGDLSKNFKDSLRSEVKRLRSKKENLQDTQILKAIKFELNDMD